MIKCPFHLLPPLNCTTFAAGKSGLVNKLTRSLGKVPGWIVPTNCWTMEYRNFESLDVWKKARELKIKIAGIVSCFPADEKNRLADLLIRSSRSICTQIAEGHGRNIGPDKIRFCIIARGSVSETINHLIDAVDAEFISAQQFEEIRADITEVEKLLNGYISYLRRS